MKHSVSNRSVICPSLVSLHPDPKFTPSKHHFTPQAHILCVCVCVQREGFDFLRVCVRVIETEMREDDGQAWPTDSSTERTVLIQK